MARKGWSQLSDDYRDRLERKGITREQYNSGESLERARGHEKTPEHPERAESNPEKYRDYLEKANGIVNDIQRLKRDIFQAGGGFNNSRSRAAIRKTVDGRVRTIADLRRIRDALESGKEEAQIERRKEGRVSSFKWPEIFPDLEEDDFSALYYH